MLFTLHINHSSKVILVTAYNNLAYVICSILDNDLVGHVNEILSMFGQYSLSVVAYGHLFTGEVVAASKIVVRLPVKSSCGGFLEPHGIKSQHLNNFYVFFSFLFF